LGELIPQTPSVNTTTKTPSKNRITNLVVSRIQIMGIKTKNRINDLLVHFEVDPNDLTEKEILLMILAKLDTTDKLKESRINDLLVHFEVDPNDLTEKEILLLILDKLYNLDKKLKD